MAVILSELRSPVAHAGAWHLLVDAVRSGLLSEQELDVAVSRVLAGRCERGALQATPPEDMPWQDLGMDQVGGCVSGQCIGS
jgi:hypothetical protein